jgi:hypothetical protein
MQRRLRFKEWRKNKGRRGEEDVSICQYENVPIQKLLRIGTLLSLSTKKEKG